MSPNAIPATDLATRLMAMADSTPDWHPAAAPTVGDLALAATAPPRYNVLTAEQVMALPPPEWIIDGLIATNTVACLYGLWGIGKSFITLDWALSIATGRAWLDHAVHTPGPVVYIAAEGASGMGRRITAWLAKTGGRTPSADRFILIDEPVNLMDDAAPTTFLATLAAHGINRPALIVFDTLSRCTLGGDENSNSEMAVAVDRATRIAKATGAGVVLVHHPGKGGDIRGASALPGAVETVIRLSEAEGVLKLECEKQKDGTKFDPFHLMLTPCEDSMIVASASMSAMAGTRGGSLSNNQRRVLEALCSPSLVGGARNSELKDASGIGNSELLRRATDALIQRGLVRVEGPPGSRDRRYHPTTIGTEMLEAIGHIGHTSVTLGHSDSEYQSHESHESHPLIGCDSVTDVTQPATGVTDADVSPAKQETTETNGPAPPRYSAPPLGAPPKPTDSGHACADPGCDWLWLRTGGWVRTCWDRKHLAERSAAGGR